MGTVGTISLRRKPNEIKNSGLLINESGFSFDRDGWVLLAGGVIARLLLLLALTVVMTGCDALDELLSDSDSDRGPDVVYVRESSAPVYFDPYYNQPKVIVVQQRPESYYESTKTKSKNGRMYKTTTVKNEWGDTVYKHTSSKKKKK